MLIIDNFMQELIYINRIIIATIVKNIEIIRACFQGCVATPGDGMLKIAFVFTAPRHPRSLPVDETYIKIKGE